jgi:lysophospholipase L1-like esterase
VASVFERHPRLTVTILLVLSVVGTDVAFTQAWLWLRAGRASDTPKLRIRSEVYHHGLRPLASLDAEEWGPGVYPYRTNSLGFRDKQTRSVPLTSEKHRLLFMGDSFTEGVGVPYEKTFVGILDAALAKEGLEVLNAAVSLYSPTIYYRKTRTLLEDVGLRFDEMVVFIDISDIQDEAALALDARGNVVLDEQRRGRLTRADWRYTAGFPRLRRLQRLLEDHTLLLSRLYELAEAPFRRDRHRAAAWTLDPEVFDDYGMAGLAQARLRMDALHELLRTRGIRLTVAVYPWIDQILAGDRDSKQARLWREWAEARGVGFLDYFPAFISGRDARGTVGRLFIPGDIHWNEVGHALVAEGFLRYYRSREEPRVVRGEPSR